MTSKLITQNVNQEIIRAVEDLKHGTGFGSIEVIVHEGRVTQIEKRERQRFSQGKPSIQKGNTSTTLSTINSEAT
ncbi:MAG: YezD family protein [Methylotenera sp.]|uniref:YezD family protein n=1 Tax=Methylotenera sp. TaxID=2051956 RepID=UPI00271E5043|nr:YezD family protein [Methylotenera sp.]MDO9152082.1 YezD family protein [Methylotenera sp.]